jgi:hypothetical protein
VNKAARFKIPGDRSDPVFNIKFLRNTPHSVTSQKPSCLYLQGKIEGAVFSELNYIASKPRTVQLQSLE